MELTNVDRVLHQRVRNERQKPSRQYRTLITIFLSFTVIWAGSVTGYCVEQWSLGGVKHSAAVKASPDEKTASEGKIVQPSDLPKGDWWGSPVIHDGIPAVQIGREAPGSEIALIRMGKYGDEPAFQFSFQHMHMAGFCHGTFYITPTRLVYAPEDHDQDSLNLLRSDNPAVYPGRYGTASFHIVYGRNMDFFPDWDRTLPTLSWKEFQKNDPDKSHYKLYERQAEEETAHDDEVYRAWWWKAYENFGEAQKRFKELTIQAFTPLTPDQQTLVTAEETAGDSAFQAGQMDSALQHYLTGLQKLPPEWAPPDITQRLQEQIIQVVLNTNPRPAAPDEAKRHYAYALGL